MLRNNNGNKKRNFFFDLQGRTQGYFLIKKYFLIVSGNNKRYIINMIQQNQGSHHTVAVLGASKKPQRYSNMAVSLLKEHGHLVYPVHPLESEIHGLSVYPSLDQLPTNVTLHTLTLYIGPVHIHHEIQAILRLQPERVILNPGTESQELIDALEKAHIPYILGCTLVMLKTGQF